MADMIIATPARDPTTLRLYAFVIDVLSPLKALPKNLRLFPLYTKDSKNAALTGFLMIIDDISSRGKTVFRDHNHST